MAEPVAAASSLVRLDRRDGVFVVACLAVAVVSGLVAWRYREQAFPEASIDFRVTREQAADTALRRMRDTGLLPEGAVLPPQHAAAFTWDDAQRIFLERSFGLQEANAMLAGDMRLFRWGLRWFTPLQKEEWRAEVTPAGEVVGASRLLREEEPGGSLTEDEARRLADAFFHGTLGRPEARWSFVESKTFKRPARTDYEFAWKRTDHPELDALDASYRSSVTVAGDGIGGFREFLMVPEAWLRDYSALRARNDTAGTVDGVFMLLTLVAIVGAFLLHATRRNVRWKVAIGFGAVGGVLALLSSLNEIPQALWGFDTTTSLSAFYVMQVVQALGAGLALALVIFLLTAAGEPEYRRDLRQHVALGALFTPSGLRTKTFFRSVVLGIALCFFFLLYQVAFYMLAARFGAWSPQEIKYDALLNTKFPWTAVLLIGFMPAVTEEFMSRMFSIPFFTRVLRSRWLAVVIAAFIWGFGHSQYPNQPFWIRGVEVGIGGIIIGWVMLRFGILAPLVWHYTVDALYTGLSLLQSDNWYFRTTAAVAIGWTLLPLAACLVLYARGGGFLPEQPLTNGAQPEPIVPERAPLLVEPAPPHRPLGSRERAFAVALVGLAVAALVVSALGRVPVLEDAARLSTSRASAIAAARTALIAEGGDPSQWKMTCVLGSDVNLTEAKYLLQQDPSFGALVRTYRDRLMAMRWAVRYFRPDEAEQWTFTVRADAPVVSEHRHALAEAAEGAQLEEADARRIAEEDLRGRGIDVTGAGWELKESRADQRPRRRDWTFEWEDATHLRERVVVGGDRVIEAGLRLHVPEAFARERNERRLGDTVLLVLRGLCATGLALGTVVLLVRQVLARRVPVRAALAVGLMVALLSAMGQATRLPGVLFGYDTSQPWSLFMTMLVTQLAIGSVMQGLGAALVYGLAAALWRGRVQPLRGHAKDALIGALAYVAARMLARVVGGWLDVAWPASSLPSGVDGAWSMEAVLPAVDLLASWATQLILVVPLLAIAAWAHERWLDREWKRVLALGVGSVVLMDASARTGPELVRAFVTSAIALGLAYAVVRLLWRGNALAWVLGIGLSSALATSLPYLAQPLVPARVLGALSLVVMAGILAIIARRARATPT